MRVLVFLTLVMMANSVIASKQIHAYIQESWYLAFVDQRVIAMKADADFANYHSSFPQKRYINPNMSLVYKDQTGKSKSIFATGTLDLISYNRNSGLFVFKLTVGDLAFSNIDLGWDRSKADVPIKGTFQFDKNHSNSTIITGKYDALKKRMLLTENNPILYVRLQYGDMGLVLDRKGDIPVTVTIE